MTRFLSTAWFEEVASATAGTDQGGDRTGGERLVIRQVVRGTPDGDVGYHVIVASGDARIIGPGGEAGPADLTITCDWDTATAIAQGKLAAQTALVEGRLRVKGDLAVVAAHAGGLGGLDPVPPAVRDRTTY